MAKKKAAPARPAQPDVIKSVSVEENQPLWKLALCAVGGLAVAGVVIYACILFGWMPKRRGTSPQTTAYEGAVLARSAVVKMPCQAATPMADTQQEAATCVVPVCMRASREAFITSDEVAGR
jgi:hypothetical protein